MSIFEKKKKELLNRKIELLKNKAHDKGKYSLFDTKFATDIFNGDAKYDHLKSIFDIIVSWEERCNIPYNIGISLDKLATDNVVMVHRTNLDLNKDETGIPFNKRLLSIMRDGLRNYGHANAVGGSGFSDIPPALTLTMTALEGLTGYINLLSPHNENDTTILCAFPKELLDEEGDLAEGVSYSDIYDLSGDVPTVKNEYMLGAILKKNNGLDEFYTRDEIVNQLSKSNTK